MWLTLPIALEFFAAFMVACAMLQSRKTKTQPWKSSQLVTLFHGLESEERKQHGKLERLIDMETTAERSNVRMQDTGEGRRLVRDEMLEPWSFQMRLLRPLNG